MAQLLFSSLVIALGLAAHGSEGGARAATPAFAAPPVKKAAPKPPAAPALRCTLLTTEAPRGGRLEVSGEGFGQTPLVRIAGRVTRTIERVGDKIAVEIPADSNGGPVSVVANKHEAQCGSLTIIGKDR